jgi:hypothetical protein
MWQFFDNGVFAYLRFTDSPSLTLEDLARFCAETAAFAGNLAEQFNLSEELITLRIAMIPAAETMLDGKYRSPEKEPSVEISRSAADLISGRENHAGRLMRRIGEQFLVPDSLLDRIDTEIRAFLESR